MSLNTLTLTEAAAGLRSRKFSVSELVRDCLLAIEARDPEVHAYLEVFDDVRQQAEDADRLRDASELLPPLFGIPLAIKDNIVIRGKRASAGSRMLANYTASYDATVIRRLQQGAIFLGRTNMDEFAMGSSTENSAFGPTKNPHDHSRVPGGSSGGSAAAVAADLAIAALGSDTGGSIRQPASLCGVVGFKPSYGAVSRHGLIPMASSLDCIGPLTKSVADARIIFRAMTGQDPLDATSADIADDPHEEAVSLRGLRIGIPREFFGEGLDPAVAETIERVRQEANKAGAELVDITLPHARYGLPAYYIIAPAEISSNLARFDGVRYGMTSAEARTLVEAYAQTRAAGFGPEVKRRIMIGTYALSAGYYDAYYLKAQQVRRLIRDDFTRAFKEVAVILGPTTPTPAFPLGNRTANPLEMYLGDIYTVGVNLAGLPAISLPAGTVLRDGKELPVGVQLIGSGGTDFQLLRIAEAVEHLLVA